MECPVRRRFFSVISNGQEKLNTAYNFESIKLHYLEVLLKSINQIWWKKMKIWPLGGVLNMACQKNWNVPSVDAWNLLIFSIPVDRFWWNLLKVWVLTIPIPVKNLVAVKIFSYSNKKIMIFFVKKKTNFCLSVGKS